jgi:putative NADH-flavin reductase
MRIAIYGATGNVGRHLVAEAAGRGHDVTALSRHQAELPGGVAWQHGDLSDTESVAKVAAEHDVIVTANGPSRVPGEDPFAFRPLIEGVVGALGATRLLVVGGAGSLEIAPDDDTRRSQAPLVRLVDTPQFPAEYKAEALASAAALEFLRSTGPDVDWTYLSPAPVFPAGEPTGRYVLGVDSPVGGTISGEDFARALVDELENRAHPRMRFTVAAPPA